MKLFYIVILAFTIQMQAQEMFKDFKIKNISANTKKQNFGTAFYKDNSIVFSSEYGGKLNLYKGEIENGDVDRHQIFTRGLSNNTHESNVAFSNDYSIVYFTKSAYGKESRKKKNDIKSVVQLFRANISINGSWSNITELPFNNKNYDVGHPTLNKENTKLYFSSNMPDGFGKSDIYVVDILPNGEYSEPRNLGPSVNTSGNELHPFISGDNYLYFSSNGHPKNFGGMDIYVAQVNSYGVSTAEHVNAPVNSKGDDFSFIIDYNKRIGFFSSNRNGGKGSDDIYYFKETIKKEKKKEKDVVPTTKPIECNQSVNGTVFLNATNEIIPNTTINLLDNRGKNLGNFNTDSNANFNFNIKCNKTYYIKAEKEGYKPFTKTIISSETNNKTNISDLFLVKIKNLKPKKHTVKPGEVGFNFNEAKILKRYTYQLDKAIILMLDNTKLFITLESHTDSRADDELNMELSERRIENIVEYMISKGVSPRNIRATAYGETKPLNHCVNGVKCTEEEYLLNRRTTFKLNEKK